jgi:prepilin-type N-terminal cleavage/methylation domain-containing protein
MMTCKQQKPPHQANPPGFTIIECLLAIIVVSLLLVGITPVIVLSVATRLQARRVELGTQAARTYIDGVQTGRIEPPNNIVVLSEIGATGGKFAPKRLNFANVDAPVNTLPATCSTVNPNPTNFYCRRPQNPSTTIKSLYCIDVDGNGCSQGSSRDLVIQAFRSVKPASIGTPNQPDPSDDGSQGYILGVRVYRANGFDGDGALRTTRERETNDETKRVATYAGGKGDRKSPLVEMTTEIRGTGTSLDSLCKRLGGCQAPGLNPNPTP